MSIVVVSREQHLVTSSRNVAPVSVAASVDDMALAAAADDELLDGDSSALCHVVADAEDVEPW